MSQTVEALLNGQKQSSGILTIQFIKEVGNATFIVGDNSGVAIMDISDKPSYGKLMNKGCWYKLIKCHKINENSIKPNDKFKPIKVHAKKELLVDQQKIKKLEESLKEIASLKVYED